MSTMKFARKPPLAKSPTRLRPRRVLRPSNTNSVLTPLGSFIKSKKLNPMKDMEEPDLRPEYRTISWELGALAKMVENEIGDEIGNSKASGLSEKSSPLFERGRFYEVYSARRNERLKRKKREIGDEVKTPYNLGVIVDSSKKRDTKKLESQRKSVSAAYSVENTAPRYSLRSLSKENKKPPLPIEYEKSAIASQKKIGVRRVRKF